METPSSLGSARAPRVGLPPDRLHLPASESSRSGALPTRRRRITTELLHSSVYLRVFIRTLETSAIVTIVCLLLGYPFAYLLTASSSGVRALLLLVVLLPFWTSTLVRSFAMVALLQDTGTINDAFRALGLSPLHLIRTTTGVVIGLTAVLLPFMVLPLFAVMVKIDGRLVQAARSLGATRRQAFFRVFLPVSLPGVIAGSFLVFVLSAGFYITPALLGSPENMQIGQLIATEFTQLLQFGQGSAMAMGLLVVVIVVVLIGSRLGPVLRAFRGDL